MIILLFGVLMFAISLWDENHSLKIELEVWKSIAKNAIDLIDRQ